ncbi:terminase small subunit [Pasteurella testudinis]|uniref:terminase small subunit n=1 Tax=Pasteurella testudinis TaxID=761 RepID=UPI000A0285FC
MLKNVEVQTTIRAGYSEKTTRQIAVQNLSKLDIQTTISKVKNNPTEQNAILRFALKSILSILGFRLHGVVF